MAKISEAQRRVLAPGLTVVFNSQTQTAWISGHRWATKRVRIGTFNALCLQGFLACTGSGDGGDKFYAITEAGRTALQESSK